MFLLVSKALAIKEYMRTKTIKLYTFDELSEKAQQRAIENVQNNLESWLCYGWEDCIKEDFVRESKRDGINIKDAYYSGFYSQGDGASFEGTVDIIEYVSTQKLTHEFKQLAKFVKEYGGHGNITQSGHYYHSGTIKFKIDLDEWDFQCFFNEKEEVKKINILMKQARSLEKIILEDLRNRADKLYKDLQNEYEYLVSDEAVKETLSANEYEFLEDGNNARI